MKRSAIIFSMIIVCLAAATDAFGQKGCELNLVGTWKAASPDGAAPLFYRFGADATVTALDSESREVGSAVYTLDNPRAPKVILLKAAKGGAAFSEGITSVDITGYDDTSLTLVKPGSGPARWVKEDSSQYFLILAGRKGTFYDGSGPAFPMYIKMDGQQTQIDAVGIYSSGGNRAFGPIPAATYTEFMREPRKDSDVMLRLEITGAQYERGMKILRTWERRTREGTLLYPDPFMDNILLVKEVSESLNYCGEKIKLYKLDWWRDDHISDRNLASHTPFLFFKELRRLNEALHVRDEQFQGRGHSMQKQAGQ
jgi:hypothetical protein